jgi:hypothetical protein
MSASKNKLCISMLPNVFFDQFLIITNWYKFLASLLEKKYKLTI